MRRAAPYSAALIALLLLPVGCKPPESGKKPEAKPSPDAPTVDATPVRVAEARVAPLQKSLAVTGSVAATQSVELAPKIAARVVFLAGREGESVRAGQVVLRQDVSDLQTQVASSEAAVRQADAQVASAIANVRAADARLAQARTQAKLQTTTSDSGIRDAEQQLASARASLAVAKKPQRTQEVRVAENVVASAQASFEKAASDKKRYEELLKEGAVAQITYEQYVTQEKLARAQLDTARQQLTLTLEGGRIEAVRQAQTTVSRAEVGLRLARANTRQNDVRKDEIVGGEAASEQARAALSQARAGVAQARANLLAARQRVDDGTVSAPIDGIIAKRSTEPGQMASPTASALTLVSLDTVYFEAQVPEIDLSSVRLGMPVEVQLDAYKGRTFSGRIAKLYPTGSTSSRSFTVRVAVPNEAGALRPGMFARGQIVQEKRSGVVVPKDAVIRTDSGPVVFVAEGNKAVKRPIEPGLSTAEILEVKKGVSAGEKIVVTGQSGLRDGAPLQIIETKAQTAATK